MRIREISCDGWRPFFDDFTRLHRGEHVSLEIMRARGLGFLSPVHDLPLAGIVEADPKGGAGEWIEVITGESSGTEAHRIPRPSRVILAERENGEAVALQIESSDGDLTVIRFEPSKRGREAAVAVSRFSLAITGRRRTLGNAGGGGLGLGLLIFATIPECHNDRLADLAQRFSPKMSDLEERAEVCEWEGKKTRPRHRRSLPIVPLGLYEVPPSPKVALLILPWPMPTGNPAGSSRLVTLNRASSFPSSTRLSNSLISLPAWSAHCSLGTGRGSRRRRCRRRRSSRRL